MAQSITAGYKQVFPSPDSAWVPSLRQLLADKTSSVTGINFGVAGLTAARVRVVVKTFGTLAAADTFTVQIHVGVTSTPNELIGYREVLIPTNCTAIVMDFVCSSQLGFQYMDVLFTASSGHSFTADLLIDVSF